MRDVVLPMDQLIASELRGRLIRYSEESERQAFEAMDPIVGLENTYKRGLGRMRALTDAGLHGHEGRQPRRTSRSAYAAAERRRADPWAALAAVQPIARELYPAMALLEGGTGIGTTPVAGGSQLFSWARTPGARRAGAGQALGRAPAGVRRQPAVGGAVAACSPSGRSIRGSSRSAWNGGCPRPASG